MMGSGSPRRRLAAVSCFILMALAAPSVVVGDEPPSMCVQLGQMLFSPAYDHQNPTYTIGAKDFTTTDIIYLGGFQIFYDRQISPQLLDMKCENNYGTEAKHIDYCPDNVEIRTHLVRQNGKVLRGWLHIEIQLTDPSDSMKYIYVQVRDEQLAAVGEFVTDEKDQCKTSSEGLVWPTPHQVYPCSGIGAREAKASSAVFVAQKDMYVNDFVKQPPYTSKEDLTRGIHFIWKLSEFWCSRHERFRIEANILTKNAKKVGPGLAYLQVLRKAADYWLHPAWFGAPDIKVGNEELDCSLEAINYATGEVSEEARKSWIQPNATRLRFRDDITNPAFKRDLFVGWKTEKILLVCLIYPWEESTKPKFGGRCYNHTSNAVLSSYTQSCSSDTTAAFSGVDLNIFQNYSDYKEKLTQGRLRQCEQKCVEPDPKNLTHLKDIQAFSKTKDNRTIEKPRVTLQILREARAESRNTTFWQTRKFHGNLCVFVAMFLIPVSNFIARYYKETFLTHYHTVPAWLWSHGTTGYVVLTLIRCSYTAMRENINNWGQSTDPSGVMHGWLGYTFIVIYTLMSTLGAVRILRNPCKVVSVIAHAVTGTLLYVMAMYLVISSHNIPGSPSAKCHNDTKLPEGTSQTAIYAYIWIGLDICFHVLMTIWQIMLDKREQIRRPGGLMAFPFLPMMQPKDRRNFVGARARKIVLIVYATAAFTMTILIIAGMFVDDDYARCDLGNLTCNDRKHPFGCSPISKKYFKIITTERYNVTDLEDFVE